MNDQQQVSKTSEFILRRLNEAFPFSPPQSSDTYWFITMGVLLLLGVSAFVFTILRKGTDKWFDPITKHLAQNQNTVSAYHAAFWRAMLFLFPAGCFAAAKTIDSIVLWWVLTIGMFCIASMLTIISYLRDSQTARWWSPLLVLLRVGVYATLAAAFMMPAIQHWEDTEKRSRVLLLIDVSPSISSTTDEVSSGSGRKPETRLEKMLKVLTDKDIDLIARIIEKNPVHVYRFGSRLDDDSTELTTASTPWTTADWKSWAEYDFKPYALAGISPQGQEAIRNSSAWRGTDPGNAEWVLEWNQAGKPEGLKVPADLEAYELNRTRLTKRVDTAQALVLGTNVGDSILKVLNQESANMVQGILLFSDGRSNMGSEEAYSKVMDATSKNKIPLFTIAVGVPRENISIAFTDLQAPDRAAPDEPFKVTVGVDGVGLPNQEAQVTLEMYAPGNDPKKGGKPDFVIPDMLKTPPTAQKPKNNGKVTFLPGDPPNGQVEFEIDPEQMPAELLEAKSKPSPMDPKKPNEPAPAPAPATGKRQLKSGAWTVIAKVPRHPKEVFAEKEHASLPRVVQVLDRPMRILMVASGPSREYQTMRALLAREMDENRAELCIYLQNEGGIAGSIVQDVPPDRLLTRFPDRLDTTGRTDTPETKFYNLNSYDLLILFDPDWDEKGKDNAIRIPENAIKNIQNWVDNLGGGIIYVAGPIHTFQLARTEEGGRLQPLLDVLPVLPEDIVVVKSRGIPREPRRLKFKPSSDFDVLKLQEDRLDDPIGGWELFFTGRDKPNETELNYLKPRNGFFSFYPIKDRKPSATVLAEFLDIDDKNQAVPKPYIVVNQPVRGRTAWIGSGEIYRIRQTSMAFYDRFWIKLARWTSANRDARAARGRVLVNKEFTAGNPIRIAARILNTDGKVYPPDQDINTKVSVVQMDIGGNVKKTFPPVLLKPRQGGTWDGYYTATVPAGVLPAGEFRYKAVVADFPDSGGDKFEADFLIRPANPELDNITPDFARLQRMASPLIEIEGRITNPETLRTLARLSVQADAPVRGKAPGVAPPADAPEDQNKIILSGKEKLAFKIEEKDAIKLIPECLDAKSLTSRNRSKLEDLWDYKVQPPQEATDFLKGGPYNVVQWWIVLLLATLVVGGLIMAFLPRPFLIVPIIAIAAIAYCRYPFLVAVALFIMVTLLSIEWMIRKLLRLA